MEALGREGGNAGRGAWLGVVAGALGWVLTALVLLRGGSFDVVVQRLAVAAPLAAVGSVTALAAFGVARRRVDPLAWLVVLVLAGACWNVGVYAFRYGASAWGRLIPLAHPLGVDFRDGLYEPAHAFTTAASGWPPFTLVVGKPFTLLGFAAARDVQIALLVCLAAASVVLTALLAARVVAVAAEESGEGEAAGASVPEPGRRVALELGLLAGLWLSTSVGFAFAVERGNIDLYALFFMLLAVWLALRPMGSPWWPSLALAVAVNLKLYPAVLIVLLLWRYRWRAVVPLVVTTAALGLLGGPGNIAASVAGQTTLQTRSQPYWWGNHSAASLSVVLREVTAWAPSWVYWPLILVPLALWVATLVLLVRRGWSPRAALLLAAACVPVMSVLPAVSLDYRLVIFVLPLTVLAAAVGTMGETRSLVWSLRYGLTGWALVGLAGSSFVREPSLGGSKYALIVLVQVLLLAVAWKTEGARAAGDTGVAGTPGGSRARAGEYSEEAT